MLVVKQVGIYAGILAIICARSAADKILMFRTNGEIFVAELSAQYWTSNRAQRLHTPRICQAVQGPSLAPVNKSSAENHHTISHDNIKFRPASSLR